jgi:hypothetical protein
MSRAGFARSDSPRSLKCQWPGTHAVDHDIIAVLVQSFDTRRFVTPSYINTLLPQAARFHHVRICRNQWFIVQFLGHKVPSEYRRYNYKLPGSGGANAFVKFATQAAEIGILIRTVLKENQRFDYSVKLLSIILNSLGISSKQTRW